MARENARRPAIRAAMLAVTAVLAAGTATAVTLAGRDPGTRPSTAARQEEVAAKGREVMPFDLDRTTHHFDKNARGGVQTVLADDPGDRSQIDLIRGHLDKEIRRFRTGDFGDPATIHGDRMPGLDRLGAGHTRIRMTYQDMPAGGRITYSTDDETLVGALHDWFDAQVSDHGRHAGHG
ncbi:hypothetical protein Sru01_35070 [Sphaerisporangium rufum]|uniref:Aspartate carbamoyltransferase n=1 Tax=Sphaerisporangium rufum TaxID=1381558 RepID=A0A919V5P7_9ACTN|nr:hypothetical protein [Sphaerisporangium rufum]GII78525.1 hypothetical protein Sru01_35070 [Sphaerisporangium rufum]